MLAAAYVQICQQHVFEPVGAVGVDTKPPTTGPQASRYAFAYKYPGTTSGFTWGDTSLGAGPAGWYISIDDIAKVLYSLNDKNDERILTSAQRIEMEATPLGWDQKADIAGYRWVQKNGQWGANGTTISTSIVLFGPGVFAALFVNSDILGPGVQNNWQWCKNCQELCFAGNASLGPCPAGGLHNHDRSMNYALQQGGIVPPGGQGNWRWCNKCEALSFAGSPSLGNCSGGGLHDHAGSGNYVLAIKGSGGTPEDTQENWRWCNKCQVIGYAGRATAGNCAAGGRHDHTGSGNYMLGYQVGADRVLYEACMKALKPV
jgi:hypothetical protein